jgi:hypothetical protein
MKPFTDKFELQRWLAAISRDPVAHSDVGIFSCYACGWRQRIIPLGRLPLKPFADTREIDRWLATVSNDPITHSDVGLFSCYAYGVSGKVIPFASGCEFETGLGF